VFLLVVLLIPAGLLITAGWALRDHAFMDAAVFLACSAATAALCAGIAGLLD